MCPGKMSGKTFYTHLRKSGVIATPDEAEMIVEAYQQFYPEMEFHFSKRRDGFTTLQEIEGRKKKNVAIEDELDEYEEEDLFDHEGNMLEKSNRQIKLYTETSITGLKKARGTINATCNWGFQPLAAVANKVSMWWIFYSEWYRVHIEKKEPRFRISTFIHDEFGVEVDPKYLQEVAKEMDYLMCKGAGIFIKDVLLKTEATAMRRWSKKAESVYDSDGNLVPYEDAVALGLIK